MKRHFALVTTVGESEKEAEKTARQETTIENQLPTSTAPLKLLDDHSLRHHRKLLDTSILQQNPSSQAKGTDCCRRPKTQCCMWHTPGKYHLRTGISVTFVVNGHVRHVFLLIHEQTAFRF